MLIPITSGLNTPRLDLSFLTDIFDVQVVGDSEASFTIENDGDVTSYTTGLGTIDIGDWIAPKDAAGANYEVFVTVNSGSLSGGTTGSWLSLGTTRTWTAAVSSGGGTVGANITVEIRRATGGAALASSTFNLSANSGP
jgi:hypothetical protein